MPTIIPIRDLRNTTAISDMAHEKHKEREPIFITKNGYSDLVIMSSEMFDKFARINHIDRIIDNAEKEVLNGAPLIEADAAFESLDKKYYGKI